MDHKSRRGRRLCGCSFEVFSRSFCRASPSLPPPTRTAHIWRQAFTVAHRMQFSRSSCFHGLLIWEPCTGHTSQSSTAGFFSSYVRTIFLLNSLYTLHISTASDQEGRSYFYSPSVPMPHIFQAAQNLHTHVITLKSSLSQYNHRRACSLCSAAHTDLVPL